MWVWVPAILCWREDALGVSRLLLLCVYVQDRVKFHVLLTTYEMLSKHLTDIKRLHWTTLVVDEAHRLKSATSKLFQVSMWARWACGPGRYVGQVGLCSRA